MKFIVDQQLPPVLAKWFEERGHSAKHVVAALAAWPVVQALHRAAAVTAPLGAAPTMR